jgi:DNA polymerase I-like protein with 3'-5' exonuclease and polymerase domains
VSALPLAAALHQAAALGMRLRLSGAGIKVDGLEALPQPLHATIRENASRIWSILDDGQDEIPIKTLAALGIEVILVEKRSECRSAIRRLITDLQDHGGPIGLDVETSPKPEYAQPRPHVALTMDGCISAKQPGQKSYRDPAGVDPHRANITVAQLYAGSDRCFVFRGAALDLLLQSRWLRRQWIVAHNAGFEVGHIGNHSPTSAMGRNRGKYDCTEQAVGLCIGVGFGGVNRSLENAAAAMLGISISKHHQLSDWSARKLSPGQIAYAAIDAIVCRKLWIAASKIIERDDLWEAYHLQKRAITPVVDMQRRGLLLDRDAHAKQVDGWSRDLANSRHKYVELTGNPPPQTDNDVRRWLETVLTLDELSQWRRTNSGQLCVDADELNKLGHVPAARPVLDMRAKERLLNNFGPTLAERISPATDRIHASFRIAAAKTGRFSSSNPNLQNLPASKAPEFRQCIIAGTDNLLVVGDYAQIEVRVAAHNSRDLALTAILAAGGDTHTANAALITGIPESKVTKEQRQLAKAVTFGNLYGQQAHGLAASAYVRFHVNMTIEEAQRAIDGFFAAYPTLAQHLQYTASLARHCGYVLIKPSGRLIRRQWEGWISYQDACNWPIQGGAADCMLLAIALVYRAFRQANIRGGLIATVHDELLAEVHRADAAEAKEIMSREMTRAFEISFPGAPTADLLQAGIGRNWRAAKEATKEN